MQYVNCRNICIDFQCHSIFISNVITKFDCQFIWYVDTDEKKSYWISNFSVQSLFGSLIQEVWVLAILVIPSIICEVIPDLLCMDCGWEPSLRLHDDLSVSDKGFARRVKNQ